MWERNREKVEGEKIKKKKNSSSIKGRIKTMGKQKFKVGWGILTPKKVPLM